jgi:hypothetical protein
MTQEQIDKFREYEKALASLNIELSHLRYFQETIEKGGESTYSYETVVQEFRDELTQICNEKVADVIAQLADINQKLAEL